MKDMAAVVKSIKKDLKMKTVTVGTEFEDPTEYASSGNLALDWCLGGKGFAFRFVAQLLGKSKAGKTSLMLKVAGNAQKEHDAYVLWIDRESAFVRDFAEKLGLDMDKVILAEAADVKTPKEAYAFFETAHAHIREVDPDAYIVMCLDSLASFSKSQEGEDMGRTAKYHHAGFRDMMPLMDKRTMLLFANHVTYKVGLVFGKPTTHAGGTAPEYYSSYILELDGGKLIKDDDGTIVGQNTQAEVVKTRLGPAHRGCIIPFYYKSGYEWYGGFMRMLVARGILRPTNKGDFKAGKLTRYQHLETDVKYQEHDVEQLLKDHPELEEEKHKVVYQAQVEEDETED
jgi:recombination protein RecA